MLRQLKKPSGWQDALELVMAAWIFISPVALGFFFYGAAALTAMFVGGIASLTSQLGIAKQQPWEEWFNIALAIFFGLSPWIFGYTETTIATWNAVISGTILAIFAILSMINEYAELREQKGPAGPTHGSTS